MPRHAKRRWMSPSARPATQSAAASSATKTGPSAPPEPAQCHKRHACHAKRRWMSPSAMPSTQRRWMSPSATPVTQSAAASPATIPAQARHQSQPSAISATPATQNEGACAISAMPISSTLATKLCVKDSV